MLLQRIQPLNYYSYLKYLLVSTEPVVLNELSLPEIHNLANFVGSDFEFDTFLWLLIRNDKFHKLNLFDSAIIWEGTFIPHILSISQEKKISFQLG
jgi:hypothetical protein